METSVGEEETVNVSVARGGPIYVPNLVGPLTSVSGFEAAVVNELEHLDFELSLDGYLHCTDDDLRVDELKILSEEDLVDMAMKEAFKDEEKEGCTLLKIEEQLVDGGEACAQVSNDKSMHLKDTGREGDSTSSLCSSSYSHSGNCCDGTEENSMSRTSNNGKANTNDTVVRNGSRKRKTSTATKSIIANKPLSDDSYLIKVEELAKIKQKQDQDKKSVKLHSFSYKMKKAARPSSERVRMLQTLRFTDSTYQVKSSEVQDHVDVHCPEVVLCVEVYHYIQKTKKTQEFLVLGRQKLTELRDKIYCLTDEVMHRAGHYDPSGYFLIEDVFCNDLRNPSAVDYSEPIFDWLEHSKDDAVKKWESIMTGELQRKHKAIVGKVTTPNFPRFQRVKMQNTRFSDLRFRVGAGYLYCHQGACKHTIVIRDMRLIHPEDIQNRGAYPVVIFQLKYRVQKCKICRIFRATKVTLDDKWAPENPCYFCDDCYYLLHHSEDGSLMYNDFLVYDYLHD